jgi:hypothetical protein
MENMQRISIPLNKLRMLFLLFCGGFFVAGGYSMFRSTSSAFSNGIFSNLLFVQGVGIASMVFFGAAFFVMLRKLLDPEPGLILYDQGLIDNSSAFPAGFVPWADVAGFKVRGIQKQQMVDVLLKDPYKYISTFKPLRRAMLRLSLRAKGSAISIPCGYLSKELGEPVALLNKYWSAYGRAA